MYNTKIIIANITPFFVIGSFLYNNNNNKPNLIKIKGKSVFIPNNCKKIYDCNIFLNKSFI